MGGILALIPARGGSKGLPGKNVRLLAGLPLISYSVNAAKLSCHPMRIVCSTDDPEIANVAREFGAEAPFLRPPHLATDEASTFDVVRHAVDVLGGEFDFVLLLQPTSPLRTAGDIDSAFALLQGAKAVVGMREADDHPFLIHRFGADGVISPYVDAAAASLRRQDLPGAYVVNGALYLVEVKALFEQKSFLPTGTRGYVMPPERSVDIDDLADFCEAERILAANK